MNRKSLNDAFKLLIVCCLSLTGCKEDMKSLYQKAVNAYQTENYQQAADLFETILEKYPDQTLSLKARYELGNIYLNKLKQPENALKHLQTLYAKSDPGKYAMESLKMIGYIYDKSLNDCLKGVDAYRLLLEKYAAEVDAAAYRYDIGECFFRLHDYEQAMQEYQKIVEQAPNPYALQASFQIANSHALLEQWDEAIERYQALLLADAISPEFGTDVMLELAFCYEQVEQFEDALKLYQKIQSAPANAEKTDTALLERKIERVKDAIKESKKSPAAVDWRRR